MITPPTPRQFKSALRVSFPLPLVYIPFDSLQWMSRSLRPDSQWSDVSGPTDLVTDVSRISLAGYFMYNQLSYLLPQPVTTGF